MPTDRTATGEAATAAEGSASRASYAAAGLSVVVAGCAAAAWRWDTGAAAWLGGLLAWAIQTGTFWPLWSRVRGGERALHVWVAGIGARAAGLGAAAALAWLAGLAVEPAAVAYGLTVMVLLWAEAYWLARSTTGGADGGAGGARSPAERTDR